jgi:acyl-CoA thioesterase-1
MRPPSALFAGMALLATLAACERAAEPTAASEARTPRPVATAAVPDAGANAPTAPRAPAQAAEPFVLVVLGDGLTADAALPADALLARQVERLLHARGLGLEVRDASAPGDATGQGLARFDKAVAEDADGVLLALGGEDAVRRTPPGEVRAALAAVIESAQARGLWVGLVGIEAPPSAAADYRMRFDALYPELSTTYGVELYPHFYSGLVDRETGEARPELFRSDGVHPTDLGVAVVAEGMADWLADTLPAQARR